MFPKRAGRHGSHPVCSWADALQDMQWSLASRRSFAMPMPIEATMPGTKELKKFKNSSKTRLQTEKTALY